jgi:hypothetical protein
MGDEMGRLADVLFEQQRAARSPPAVQGERALLLFLCGPGALR